MYSLSGQQSWNFFKNNFTTRIGAGPPELVPLKLKFQEATNYVTQVGLSDWGLAGEDGKVVAQPRTPFMLTFQPAANLGMQGVQQASFASMSSPHRRVAGRVHPVAARAAGLQRAGRLGAVPRAGPCPACLRPALLRAGGGRPARGGPRTGGQPHHQPLGGELTTDTCISMVCWCLQDEHLMFRHQDAAEDLVLHPEWEESLQQFGLPHRGCPVAAPGINV